MQHIIEHDITNFLFSISIKYNIDLEILRDRYIPIITIEKKNIKLNAKLILERNPPPLPIPKLDVQLEHGIMASSHLTTTPINGFVVVNAQNQNMPINHIVHSILNS